jgi:hypothetical protein
LLKLELESTDIELPIYKDIESITIAIDDWPRRKLHEPSRSPISLKLPSHCWGTLIESRKVPATAGRLCEFASGRSCSIRPVYRPVEIPPVWVNSRCIVDAAAAAEKHERLN